MYVEIPSFVLVANDRLLIDLGVWRWRYQQTTGRIALILTGEKVQICKPQMTRIALIRECVVSWQVLSVVIVIGTKTVMFTGNWTRFVK